MKRDGRLVRELRVAATPGGRCGCRDGQRLNRNLRHPSYQSSSLGLTPGNTEEMSQGAGDWRPALDREGLAAGRSHV
ncbi:hypothetical protein NDU88_009634 [Pleurodeles waltl]|uniref:Uncharacterized protein n=1 Tax=Pleurodeles waltl TaxID=8319 RepID=A0AAV7RYW9_PLEWA|nr:hypothetical protein NDU88_009634 [Pleurodeles waltl]